MSVTVEPAEPTATPTSPTSGSTRHYLALDGLRGMAAFVVMLAHSAYLLTDSRQFAHPVTTALMAIRHLGHQPVVLFFALSGFVLYLAFARNPDTPYGAFVLRRAWRIFPAALVALAFSVAVHLVTLPRSEPGLGPWTTATWVFPVDLTAIGRNAVMLGVRNEDSILNPVVWSLAIEMRFSLLLPLLALLCRRSRAALVAVSIAAYLVGWLLLDRLGMHPSYLNGISPLGTVAVTLFYLPCFGFGVVAADVFIAQQQQGRRFPVWPATVVALIAVVAAKWSGSDFALSVAFTVVILAACQPGPLGAIARWPAAQFIGQISYSLYLIHFPILMTFAYALAPRVPLVVAAVGGPVASIVAATVMHRFVELPGIAFGRLLVARLSRRAVPGGVRR